MTTPSRRPALLLTLVVLSSVAMVASIAGWVLSDETALHTVLDMVEVVIPGAYVVVGTLLSTRRPENAVGWLCLVIGLAWSIIVAADGLARWGADAGSLDLASWVGLLGSGWVVAVMLTLHLALRLPDGKLLSPRWRPWSWLCTFTMVVVLVWQATTPGRLDGIEGTHNPLAVPRLRVLEPLFVLIIVCLLAAVTSLVLRYRRAGTVERLQLRWIAVSGVVLLLVGGTIAIVVGSGDLPPVAAAFDVFANAMLPVSIGVAVMRYRLYEIDTVINRTLVYGSLTATLAVVYVSLVLVLQLVANPLTHDSALVTATSTLAVAALFRPARARIQDLVDRRFYRSKYDAARTLEAFGARLRDEVDLEALTADLRSVASETMQPAHASIWLVRGRRDPAPGAP